MGGNQKLNKQEEKVKDMQGKTVRLEGGERRRGGGKMRSRSKERKKRRGKQNEKKIAVFAIYILLLFENPIKMSLLLILWIRKKYKIKM